MYPCKNSTYEALSVAKTFSPFNLPRLYSVHSFAVRQAAPVQLVPLVPELDLEQEPARPGSRQVWHHPGLSAHHHRRQDPFASADDVAAAQVRFLRRTCPYISMS